jgi:hypothetical protein
MPCQQEYYLSWCPWILCCWHTWNHSTPNTTLSLSKCWTTAHPTPSDGPLPINNPEAPHRFHIFCPWALSHRIPGRQNLSVQFLHPVKKTHRQLLPSSSSSESSWSQLLPLSESGQFCHLVGSL